MDKKIIIFQFRNGVLEENERRAFTRRLSLSPGAYFFINVLNGNNSYPSHETIGGIIIAGSGDYSMTVSHPWYDSLAAYIRDAIERNIPILGVCFGHQFLARLCGAKVIQDPGQKELGSVAITINSAGLDDPLLRGIDQTFYTIAGHNDSVVELPDQLEVL